MDSQLSSKQTMTSKELHQIVFDATGKFKELKHFHDKVRKVLKNQEGRISRLAQKLPPMVMLSSTI